MSNLTNFKNNNIVALLQFPAIISLQAGKILGMIPVSDTRYSFIGDFNMKNGNLRGQYFGNGRELKYAEAAENVRPLSKDIRRRYCNGGCRQ